MAPGSPFIIIGMHRSGTSLVSRFLERLGVFMGWRKDPNNEALLLTELNEWIFRQAGASWDHPQSVDCLLQAKDLRSAVTALVSGTLNTPRALRYLGYRNYLRWRTPFAMTEPWGWKDPRNTVTLPIWLELFPGARVIHVRRHGVDVAHSLRERRNQEMQKVGTPNPKPGWRASLVWVIPEIPGLAFCHSLEKAFQLWEWYLEAAETHIKSSEISAIDVRYEDLLANPTDGFKRIAEFCELSPDRALLRKAAAEIDSGRAFAFRGHPQLERFAEEKSDTLERFGY